MVHLRLVSTIFLLSAAELYGQCPDQSPSRPPCGLAGAVTAAKDLSVTELLKTAIEPVRRDYWKVFPNYVRYGRGYPGYEAAEKAFFSALRNKDMYYMMIAIPQGMTGDTVKMANSIAVMGGDLSVKDIGKFPTNLDGGIRPYAFPMFVQWVNALRRAQGREKDGAFASPTILATALQAESNWRRAYEDARDWAEFLASPLDVSKYLKPQSYMVNQMEADVSFVLARSKPERLPEPRAAALDLYNFFVKTAGEKEVLAAATAVLHAPKNSVGGLATPAEVSIGAFVASPSPNPYLLFLTKLTTGSPRAWAVALCFDQNALLAGQATEAFNSKEKWAKAAADYGVLAGKFGEPAMLSAAAKLKDLPKNDRGGPRDDPQSRNAIYWFTALLKDPKTPLPEEGNFLVGSYDPRWLGKMVAVRGTVSRVDVDRNSHPPYATIHFKEAKNDRFYAFTPNSEILDGQNLAGKPIEVTGQVTDWREGAGVNFLGGGQLKVLDAAALANFKESSPTWMKAPLVDNRVDNPKYLAWKKFPVGAKADYVEDLLHEYQPGTDAYTKSRIARLTFTLVSIDDERAVVKAESTVSRRTGGDSYSSDDQIFKAKVPAPGAHSDNPTQVLTRGEETLTINGKEIHTRWECVAQAKDPLTFTKTWTSDEVPGGLVRLQQQTHSGLIAGQDYRSISQTFYAPLAGVEPVLGNDAPPADTANHAPAPANPASPTGGKGAAIAPVPTASAPPPAAPPSRGAPAMTPDFTKRFSAVMMRAAKDQVGLAQAEAGLSRAGTALPDHIRAARDRMTSQQQAVALAFRTRDNAAAEQNLRALEDTLAVIEKFIGK